MVILPVSTISANAELEDDDEAEEDELLPRLPAAVLALPAPEPELPVDDAPPAAAPELEPADTVAPGVRLESETTVPVAGA
jgi:hypothetical protein